MKRTQIILGLLALLFFFAVFMAIEHRVQAQSQPMVFSVGVNAKVTVSNLLKIPRCASSDSDCAEYTKLCDSTGACVTLNAGDFTLHGGTTTVGGASQDVPFGTLTLTLGQP
jgi:hypothetical protein